MPSTREGVIRALERLLEADKAVRMELQDAESILRQGIKRLEGGEPISTSLTVTKAAVIRQNLNDALVDLQAARHDLRTAVIAAGLEEGMSLSDIARAFGVSRQLVQRFAKEMRAIE